MVPPPGLLAHELCVFFVNKYSLSMYNSTQEEQKILRYWEKNKCFEKSVESRPKDKPYHFYDGPPFATGTPHYGHIVASLMKDVVPRYWTMKGYRVERRWGWDCHGLPVENIIERELKLKSKKDIENYGVAKFNEACRSTVLMYAAEWKKTVRRMGRWVDMENDYKTMDLTYMESVWWAFKQLWDRKLIYKGHKPMHICPRCVTPLSNFEVTLGYKDISDSSVTVKFKIKNPDSKMFDDETVYILAWTTTPWTLPGNILLAVNEPIDYVALKIEGEEGVYVVAEERAAQVMEGKKYKVIKEMPGHDLVGLEYEPLFPYFADTPNAFRVVSANFVTVEDGTGVVHIAPAFGEDDFNLGEKEQLPLVQHVSMDGRFIPAVADFAGLEVKPKENPAETDQKIISWLKNENKLFSEQRVTHSYPHCWRCDTPLLNYATVSWFVRVTELKDQLIKNNDYIHWVPGHIKEGRFGQWLEGARDWAISRNRFWGAPLPIWQNDEGEVLCIGSRTELEELSGEKVNDLHKHLIDGIEIKKDDKLYHRIPEVLDCWFESGSMPYAQMHYPFENKEKFEAAFPAEFIAEGEDQTRGWFYTLHVLAAALTSGAHPAIPVKKSVPAFNNVIVNGTVLAEDGKKMSKRLKNYPEPDIVMEKFGADAMRYYLATSPVMEAENLNFSEAGVREVFNKVINTLWNVVEFYKMYAGDEKKEGGASTSDNILDKWILAKLNLLVDQVTKGMEKYELVKASRPVGDFITELSQWYVRRSRDRFKGENVEDKAAALATLSRVLTILSKTIAPFMPFIAEKIYQDLLAGAASPGSKESVHLEDWPTSGKSPSDDKIMADMVLARKIVEVGLAVRAEKGIKVRQPLSKLVFFSNRSAFEEAGDAGGGHLAQAYLDIIADELNIKEVSVSKEIPVGDNWASREEVSFKAALNIEVTEELKREGLARELIRTINQIRKDMKLTVSDRIDLSVDTSDDLLKAVLEEHSLKIQQSVLARDLQVGRVDGREETEVDGRKIKIKISK